MFGSLQAEKLEYMGVAMQGNAQDLCQARDAAQGNQDDIIRKLAKQLQVRLPIWLAAKNFTHTEVHVHLCITNAKADLLQAPTSQAPKLHISYDPQGTNSK